MRTRIGRYTNQALMVMFDRARLSTVTSESTELPERRFAVKNWSENQALAAEALESGEFIDTGETIQTGMVYAPVWEIPEDHPAWQEFIQ